jgi:hypothetical protein
MNLITSAQRQKLLENGRAQRAALDQKTGAIDFEPVVKLFTPDGNATWLLTELDLNGEYLAFDFAISLSPPIGEFAFVAYVLPACQRGLFPRRRSRESAVASGSLAAYSRA